MNRAHATATTAARGDVPIVWNRDNGPLASEVRIRPIDPADEGALRTFYGELSNESRRTRFFAPTAGIAAGQSTWFCSPDHDHREGFVAVTAAAGRPDRIVGHVCVDPDGPGSAEIAVAVSDAMRGRGIGRRLVHAAVAWGRADGLSTLTATMLAANPAIQRLLSGLGVPSVSRPIGAGVVEIRLNLSAVAAAA
ncbi:MAG: hypothetical protein QOF49_1092 [Chloroflexota bacterium]|jgi:RimJ/RimL family protein N-acetyltransferase|nr:hypothetical protein [Chloroflexota bacterium]